MTKSAKLNRRNHDISVDFLSKTLAYYYYYSIFKDVSINFSTQG